MKKSVEATGKTIELAIQAALNELGKERDQVSVEVLDNPKTGFFGIGSVPAKVLVTYEPSRAGKIEEFLVGLLEKMGTDAIPVVKETDGSSYAVELTGQSLGMLIGRRGETLDAIQHITNYAVNREEEERVHVSIDAENYRRKREESLERLANKIAGKVIKYRKNLTLEPMNAYERHVIHSALQDHPDIATYSTGSEPNRRVVVAYSKYKSVANTAEN